MIPTDELEGRWSAATHERLVESAADAGMNTIRVWGGGSFLPDAFYDACDARGILVYHDMMSRSPRGYFSDESRRRRASDADRSWRRGRGDAGGRDVDIPWRDGSRRRGSVRGDR